MSSGTIFTRTRNGKTVWLVEITIGHHPDGRRKRIRRTAHSKAEAIRLRAELLGKAHTGELAPRSKEHLDSFALWWIRVAKAPHVRPATAGDYETRYRHSISPVFGHRRITDITARDVANWLHGMSEQGYSVTTINGARQILSMVLDGAIQFDHIRTNPVKSVPKHKPTYTAHTTVKGAWSREETVAALRASQGTDIELAVALAVVLGMRRSEILGLQWTDFDFEHGTLHIRRSRREARVFDANGTSHRQLDTYPTKNPSSARKLILGPAVTAAVLAHRARQDEAGHYSPQQWVMTSTTGTPLEPRRLNYLFDRFSRQNGIRKIRFHDLRHTSAQLALSGKARIEAVSQFLGHSNIHTTKSIYAPYVEALNQEYVDAIGQQLESVEPLSAFPPPPPGVRRGG